MTAYIVVFIAANDFRNELNNSLMNRFFDDIRTAVSNHERYREDEENNTLQRNRTSQRILKDRLCLLG